MSAMQTHKVVLKLFLAEECTVSQESYIPVFHRVIREKILSDILIDVADYRHVHEGPGVMLIGHESDFAMDQGQSSTGLRFNRKRGDLGGLQPNLMDGLSKVLRLAKFMEDAPEFQGRLRFCTQKLFIGTNDRLKAPNTDETYQKVEPLVRSIAVDLYGDKAAEITRVDESRSLFGVHLKAREAHTLGTLIDRLAQ